MTNPLDKSIPRAMLVGSPRSGTTWLAKLIDSHPGVLYRHEPDSINVRPDIPFVPDSSDIERYRQQCLDYIDLLFAERAIKSSGSQPMFAKSFRSDASEQMRKMLIYSTKAGERILSGNALLSSLQIPDMLSTGRSGPQLLFLKSVSSLCRTYMFSRAEPGLKFLHIIRHPCAYVASTLRGKQLGLLSDDAYIETLAKMPQAAAYDWTIARLGAMSREQQLTARWMLQNDKVLEEMNGEPNYLRVVYEDLCADPKRVLAEVFEFLGLSLESQSLEFLQESSVGKGKEVRYFDLKRDSLGASTGWQRELSASQIKQIQDVVAPSRVGSIYV
jgi:LPS sulfotransferase NodH